MFFETKKTVNTQAPRAQSVKNPWGALGSPRFVTEFPKLKRLGCLRVGLVIPDRKPVEQNARQQRTDRVDQRKVGILL